MDLKDRFLKYVSFDTQSDESSEKFPSTDKQLALLKHLVEEMKGLGMTEVSIDKYGYAMGTIPATPGYENVPVIGFIAHVDTAPDMSGANVKPQIIEKYDGKDIRLNENTVMTVEDFPELPFFKGHTLIHTDGTTLLGADDKAGVAEIMTAAEYLLNHPEIKHGKIRLGFTPDEEIGRGVDFFDVKAFGAQFAYTVDGGELGDINYESFNAADLKVHVHGRSIHPGSAKGKMINALLVGMEFHRMLPVEQNPMYTEGYEGFYHLEGMSGNEESALLHYIVRDHDRVKFEEKKQRAEKIAAYLNGVYGEGCVQLELSDTYYNMREVLEDKMEILHRAENAFRACGVEPSASPVRGGTDGSRLSFMGLPCPNLSTGGANCHGRFELASVPEMETMVEVLFRLVQPME